MQTRIHPQLAARPEIVEADRILRSCVHCGFCTAVCPTYQLLGDELDGPRGRIYLIKDLLEEARMSPVAAAHIDRCLTCRACETACPSGVQYGRLLDIGKGVMAETVRPGLTDRTVGWLLRAVVTRPRAFSLLLAMGQAVRRFMPASIRKAVPGRQPVRHYPRRRAARPASRVVILEGCVQRAATPNVNRALEFLLGIHDIGFEYVAGEGCCGAVDYHLSAHAAGIARMKSLVDRLLPVAAEVDAIVSTASGCGLTIKEYPRVLAGDPVYAERARRVAEKVLDASEFLAGLEFDCEPARVAFQSPCSLQHGQRLVGVVEGVLERAGLELVPVREGHLCCGSAGSYSIMQPELANRLRERKVAALEENSPEFVVTANVGCHMHLQSSVRVPVLHWLELIADRVRLIEDPPQ